jgi:hypothetical protein
MSSSVRAATAPEAIAPGLRDVFGLEWKRRKAREQHRMLRKMLNDELITEITSAAGALPEALPAGLGGGDRSIG